MENVNDSKLGRRDFLITAGLAGASMAAGSIANAAPPQNGRRPKTKSVMGLRTPKMETVRVGFIGVGSRGSGHVTTMLTLEGVDVKAISDTHRPNAERSAQACVAAGRSAPDLYTEGDRAYRQMLERDDIDVVLISTPWDWHVPMSVDAMKAGKHVLLEVPAAQTVEGCWELVETAEQTQRNCMMLENVCYGREELMVLNMCRQGLFGELLHGEAAYIHDLRGQMNEVERGTGSWRTYEYARHNGNLYPTHGLGPVAQYMNVNRGDRLDYLTSMSSPALVREKYAKDHFPEGHKWRKLKFTAGDINTTLVKTALGRTIMIQWDEQLPRPYTRHNLIQGTQGCWAGFPDRIVVEGKSPSTERWEQGKDLDRWYREYDHPLWKRLEAEAKRNGGHGGMDFVMLWRIVYCLRNGEPLDQDVYDAAAWSVITPLSERSVKNRGQSVDVPDFTRGEWKKAPPLAIVS